MMTRLTGMQWVCVLWLLVAGPAGAQEGQPELDKAMDLKISANSLQDLAEVAALCEKALEKGLAKDDDVIARQLLTGALYERAGRMCQPIMLSAPVMSAKLKEMRDRVMPDLEKILKYDSQFGPAHLLIAQLQALDGGDAQRARESVDRAVGLLAEDHKLLAEALVLRSQLPGPTADPLADLNRAVELAPDDAEVWQARAMYYMRHGQIDKAVSDFNGLVERDSDNMMTRLGVAEQLIKVQQYDEALKHLKVVIDQKPSALAYTLRAQLWTQQEKLDEAVKDLDEAVKLDPDDLGLVLMRARLQHAAGRHDLAEQDVDRVLQARADIRPAIELRSSILAAKGKYAEAAQDIAELLKKEPDNVLLQLQLGIYLNAGSQSHKAIEVFDKILSADPQNGLALRGRADAYLNVGEHRKAVADYDVVVKMYEDDSGILNNFAWVLATSTEDAIRNGKRALEMGLKACELTEYQQAHILSTLAAAYAETGDFENAVKWSQKSVDLGDPDIQEQLKQELNSYQQKKPWREKKEEPATEPAKPADHAAAEK
jgi:tetratricopeptide (TPR) repeat protein